MGRYQISFSNKRVEELVFFKKLEIVARRRHVTPDYLCKCLLLDSVNKLDQELNFWIDKSDEELKREIMQELKNVTIRIDIRKEKV